MNKLNPYTTACASHKSGDKNKNKNSSGSVTPAKKAVTTVGIKIEATFFLFSGRAVFQSAKKLNQSLINNLQMDASL